VTATRAEVAKGLHALAGAIEADESIPLPASCWPLTFHAPEGTSAETVARSLGVTDWLRGGAEEEDGSSWEWLTGYVGGVHVRITADAGPVLLDPLTDESAIVRTYAGVTS
jgi:hypothetical protein